MEFFRRFISVIVILMISGCSLFEPKNEAWITVKIKDQRTRLVYECDKPILDSNKYSASADGNLKIAIEAKDSLEKVDLNSTGEAGGNFKLAIEKVRLISQQNLDYMSFLYPLCKAHAEGSINDGEYTKKLIELMDKFIKDNQPEVSIFRTYDFSKSGCVNGSRYYDMTYVDNLTFSKRIEFYDAQALTNNNGGSQKAEVSYFAGKKEVFPEYYEKLISTGVSRKRMRILVSGTSRLLKNPIHAKIAQPQNASKDPCAENQTNKCHYSAMLALRTEYRIIIPSARFVL